jgi:hypothetical protein
MNHDHVSGDRELTRRYWSNWRVRVRKIGHLSNRHSTGRGVKSVTGHDEIIGGMDLVETEAVHCPNGLEMGAKLPVAVVVNEIPRALRRVGRDGRVFVVAVEPAWRRPRAMPRFHERSGRAVAVAIGAIDEAPSAGVAATCTRVIAIRTRQTPVAMAVAIDVLADGTRLGGERSRPRRPGSVAA